MSLIIDTFFISLIAVVFGTIIWFNITETSKARKRFREPEQAKRQQCN